MELVAPPRAPLTGVLLSAAVALLFPALAYFLFGGLHLNLADEGYLWYGVQRTVEGAVPLRDFQAYDPGRYHWCAALAPLVGDGILGVRAAAAAFQALGLFCGLLVTLRCARHPAWQLFFGLVLALWMFPRHKLFESSLALMAAWIGVRLVERPSAARHLAAGAFVGLAAYFGRNLALYAGVGTAALVLLLRWKLPSPGFARRAGAYALGVALGCLPLAGMLLFVPGYAASYVESLRVILEEGANLAKPWPWPWRVETAGLDAFGAFGAWMDALAFLLPLAALPVVLVVALRSSGRELALRAPLVGSGVLGVFFLHHATVRSDVPHLAQCIQPLLLALLALPLVFERRRRGVEIALWSGLALVTAGVARTSNPSLTNTLGRELVPHEVAGERLELQPAQAGYLAAIEREVGARVADGGLFIAPNRPALYCVLGKVAPTWWIYFFWKASAEEQEAMIATLREKRVDWALVIDTATDGRRELLFRSTNDLVWAHFESEWRRVPTRALPQDHVLFRRR